MPARKVTHINKQHSAQALYGAASLNQYFWEKMDKVSVFCICLMLLSMYQVEVKGEINFNSLRSVKLHFLLT